MHYLNIFDLDVPETGYIFFPGEVWLFMFSVVITLILIWYIER